MKIQIGIASTTHLDLQNQKMAKSALDGMAEQTNSKYIPQLIEHDWDRWVGVCFYGEVFELPDGEFALGIVIGVFENESEKKQYKSGEKNTVFQDYKNFLDIGELIDMFKSNKSDSSIVKDIDVDEGNIALLLEKYLNSTQISPQGEVYTIKHFIASSGNLKIEIYPKDHEPAHFHVVSKDGMNARFNLETFEYMNTKSGKITEKQKKQIKSFLQTTPFVVERLKSEYKRFRG